MRAGVKHLLEFGPFRLDVAERLLLREGEVVPLTPKVFDLLVLLAENSGRLLEREELIKAVWADRFVEEANLTVGISTIRKVLGEQETGQPYIETVPKKGYRFVAEVRESRDKAADLIPREHIRTQLAVEHEAVTDGGNQPQTAVRAPAAGRAEPEASTVTRLRALGAVVAIIALGAAALYLWKGGVGKQAGPGARINSIAVLPFHCFGDSDETVGLGMADVLITRLGGMNQMVVRPTSAVFKYMGSEQDIPAVGRELKVDAVIEGSIQKVNGHLRVTARLVRAQDGGLMWAETFDGALADIFMLQDRISEQIAARLAMKPAQDRVGLLTKHYTESAEAYQAYVKGRYFWNKRTEDGLRKAIEYFELAAKRDKNFALAYSGLADSYMLLGTFGVVPPDEVFPRAKIAAQAAVRIDDTLAEARTSLAYIRMLYEWDWPGAEREFKRAIELNNNYATAHHWYSEYLAARGQFDEALSEAERAQELDPQSLIINTNIGYILYLARRHDKAIEEFKKVLEMDQGFGFARSLLGQAYAAKGMWGEALLEWEGPVDSISDYRSGNQKAEANRVYEEAGLKAYLRNRAEMSVEQSNRGYISSCVIAGNLADCGDAEGALKYLELAYEKRDPYLVWIKVGPTYDILRSDRRFQELLRRMRFAP